MRLSLKVGFTFYAALGYIQKKGLLLSMRILDFIIMIYCFFIDDKNKMNTEEVQIDGTFKMTPRISEVYQLLTLIAVIDEVC